MDPTHPAPRPAISPEGGRVRPLQWTRTAAETFQELLDAYEGADSVEELVRDLTVWSSCTYADLGSAIHAGLSQGSDSLATADRIGLSWGRAPEADRARGLIRRLAPLERLVPTPTADIDASLRAVAEALRQALVETLGTAPWPTPDGASRTLTRLTKRYMAWAAIHGRTAGRPLVRGLEAGYARLGDPKEGLDAFIEDIDALQRIGVEARSRISADLYLEEAVGAWTGPCEWTPQLSALWRAAVTYQPGAVIRLLERVPALRPSVLTSDASFAMAEAPADLRSSFFRLLGPVRGRPRSRA